MDRKKLIDCMKDDTPVFFNDIKYIPLAYILRKGEKKWFHSVELKDLKANSIVIADLDKVIEVEEVLL